MAMSVERVELLERMKEAFVWAKSVEHNERMKPSTPHSEEHERMARFVAQALEDAWVELGGPAPAIGEAPTIG